MSGGLLASSPNALPQRTDATQDRNNNEATMRFVPVSEANCQYESVHRLPLREFRTHPFEMD